MDVVDLVALARREAAFSFGFRSSGFRVERASFPRKVQVH